jgi:hypothetical protein
MVSQASRLCACIVWVVSGDCATTGVGGWRTYGSREGMIPTDACCRRNGAECGWGIECEGTVLVLLALQPRCTLRYRYRIGMRQS